MPVSASAAIIRRSFDAAHVGKRMAALAASTSLPLFALKAVLGRVELTQARELSELD